MARPSPTPNWKKSLAGGVASGSVFPVLCCSGLTGVGVDRLARLIEELCPAPDAMPPVVAEAGSTTAEIPCDAVRTDSGHGHQDLHRHPHRENVPVQGALGNPHSRYRADQHPDPGRGALACSRALSGHTTTPTTSVAAGDFVAIPRLNGTRTGDTLAPKGQPVAVPAAGLPASGTVGGRQAGDRGPTTTSSCLPCSVSATRISPSP